MDAVIFTVSLILSVGSALVIGYFAGSLRTAYRTGARLNKALADVANYMVEHQPTLTMPEILSLLLSIEDAINEK
jgi:hypothetical protein